MYGAHITPKLKTDVGTLSLTTAIHLSAAALRRKNLQWRHQEKAKGPRKYDLGNMVYIAKKEVPYTNAIIVGYEWGGDYKPPDRSAGPKEWLYYIVEAGSLEGAEYILIPESQIHGRISL